MDMLRLRMLDSVSVVSVGGEEYEARCCNVIERALLVNPMDIADVVEIKSGYDSWYDYGARS